MTGEMVFAQFFILEMMRVFRRLELVQLGLFMRIVLENCLMQAPLDRRDDKLPKLLGCKTRKTFERHLDALIEKGMVRETEGGIIACIAEKAIEHFQKNSKDAKRAVESRKDRQKPSAENVDPQKDVAPLQGHEGGLPAASAHQETASEEGDAASFTLPFDRFVEELHGLAEHKGHSNLAEALTKEEAQRQVEAWLELGLPPEKIIEKVIQVMNAKGDERISSWKYFDQAMRDMARVPGG